MGDDDCAGVAYVRQVALWIIINRRSVVMLIQQRLGGGHGFTLTPSRVAHIATHHGQVTEPRRGAAHRRQHRQAAGAAEAVMNGPGLAPAAHLLGIVGGGLWSCVFPSILLSP